MTTRTCVACGSPITVTTRNPNRRSARRVAARLNGTRAIEPTTLSTAPTTLPTPFTRPTPFTTPFGPPTAPHDARTAATDWPSSPSSSPPTPPTSKHRR